MILPIGDFQLSGNVYPIEEAVMITNDRFKKFYKRMEEFRKNVNSGIYPNILDFNYIIDKKFYSIIYEVKDRYFDSLFFFKEDSENKLWSSSPQNIPNEERIDEKNWRGVRHLVDTDLSHIYEIDKEIAGLDWKKDRVGMLIMNGKAYWLLNDGIIVNYNDRITSQMYGLPDYLDPGFASVENYLSRIFEDSIAQYLQDREINFH